MSDDALGDPARARDDLHDRAEHRADDSARPAGILLAAGEGRRLGQPKALVPFHGELLVHRGIRLLAAGGCDPIVVVAGASARAVRAAVDRVPQHDPGRTDEQLSGVSQSLSAVAVPGAGHARVIVVHNDHWQTGMGSSLRAGLLAARDGEAQAAVVALVDQPLVAPAAVERLIAAWRNGHSISAAAFSGVVRNPVLFDAAVWNDVHRSAVGDRGARALLRDRFQWVQPVPCDDVASPADIDTPADLLALADQPDLNPPPARADGAAKEQQWN